MTAVLWPNDQLSIDEVVIRESNVVKPILPLAASVLLLVTSQLAVAQSDSPPGAPTNMNADRYHGEACIQTPSPMQFTDESLDDQPSGGQIQIGTDNFSIDASNGDPSSFTLTVTDAGATSSLTVPFSDTRRFNVPVTSSVDIGF